MPDQMAEDQPLHRIGQRDHHHHRQQNREERRHVPAEMVNIRAQDCVDQVAKRHLPIDDPRQSQGRKQRHDPLGIVKNTRGFVDQNKPQGDQCIKHTRHKPVQEHLDCKGQLLRHIRPSPSQNQWQNQSWATSRYASITSWLLRTSLGVPSPIFLP